MDLNYNAWPHAGWWNLKEEYARKMTDAELAFARRDCREAAEAGRGLSSENKYRDEGSVYAQEARRRAGRG